jgi:hypothetical protein
MTLRRPDTLRRGLEELVRDVGPLNAVSVLGFDDADTTKVDDNLARARDAVPHAAWLDLREASDNAAADALIDHGDASLLVLLVHASNLPTALALFLRQAVDKIRAIPLNDGRIVYRSEQQSVVVLAQGCDPYATAPPEFQRIPFWVLASYLDAD